MVFEAKKLKLVAKGKDQIEQISDIKFSPNSQLLAVGSHDNTIVIYEMPPQECI